MKPLGKNYIEILEDMAGRNTHDESDEIMLSYILNHVFQIEAKVTCGMIYAKGINKPEPIGQASKQALKALNEILDYKRKEGVIE